jgi:cytoskeletal protein RodZ
MRNNQKGFSPIIIVIIIVVIGALGGVGWYIYKANQTKPETAKTGDITTYAQCTKAEGAKLLLTVPEQCVVNGKKFTNPTQLNTKDTTTPTPTKTDPMASWKTYENKQFLYSFKYPGDVNWESYEQPTTAQGLTTSSVGYKGCGPNCGSAFSVIVEQKGDINGSISHFGENQMDSNSYYSQVSKTNVKVGDTSGTRWEYKPADGKSANTVYYSFLKGKTSYKIVVNGNGAIPIIGEKIDITKYGEDIYSTFKFN